MQQQPQIQTEVPTQSQTELESRPIPAPTQPQLLEGIAPQIAVVDDIPIVQMDKKQKVADRSQDSSGSSSSSSEEADGCASSSAASDSDVEQVEGAPGVTQNVETFEMMTEFLEFIEQAVLGEESIHDACRKFWLGGFNHMLPDMLQFALLMTRKHSGDMRSIIWMAVLTSYLGCGGPGFKVMSHLLNCKPYFPKGVKPPKIPKPHAGADVEPLYKYLFAIERDYGRKHVLSGDGTATKFRFCETGSRPQGLPVLQQWHAMSVTVCDLLEEPTAEDLVPAASLSSEDLEARRIRNLRDFGPIWFSVQLQKAKFLKSLTAKELFGYVGMFYPSILEEGTVPFGGGGIKGYVMVKYGKEYSDGKNPDGKKVSERDAQRGTSSLLSQIPHASASRLQAAVAKSIRTLPASVQNLPGFKRQLAFRGGINTLDLEICYCWFKSFKKNKDGPSSSWAGFKRSAWKKLAKQLTSA